MLRITFLGTGGGRFVTISQIVSTGGWILEMDGEMIHVDPGPGAILRAKECNVNLRKLTGIIVSHAHLDHYGDLEVVIEAMTYGAKKKRGFLISNEAVIKGRKDEPPKISPYHLNVLERYTIMKPGMSIKVGNITITATPTKHGDEDGLGFVFDGSERLGYTGDGEYFEGQEKYFQGCKYLVLNCMRPKEDAWPNHMNSEQARILVEKVKPDVAILAGFGMKMLFGKAHRDAEWIQKETGIKTMAARDGMVLDFGKARKNLERFL